MSSLSRYIAYLHSTEPSADQLKKQLANLGITLDLEYGLVAVNPAGNQLVGRVVATEDAIHLAEETLPVSFFPDLGVSATDENLE